MNFGWRVLCLIISIVSSMAAEPPTTDRAIRELSLILPDGRRFAAHLS